MKQNQVVSESKAILLVILLIFVSSCNINTVSSDKSGIRKLNFPYKFSHFFMEKSKVIPLANSKKYLAISDSYDIADHETVLTVLNAKGKILRSKSFLSNGNKNNNFNIHDTVERNGCLFGSISCYIYDAKNPSFSKSMGGFFKLNENLVFD